MPSSWYVHTRISYCAYHSFKVELKSTHPNEAQYDIRYNHDNIMNNALQQVIPSHAHRIHKSNLHSLYSPNSPSLSEFCTHDLGTAIQTHHPQSPPLGRVISRERSSDVQCASTSSILFYVTFCKLLIRGSYNIWALGHHFESNEMFYHNFQKDNNFENKVTWYIVPKINNIQRLGISHKVTCEVKVHDQAPMARGPPVPVAGPALGDRASLVGLQLGVGGA